MCTSAEPAFDENAQPNTPSKHSSKGSDIIRSDSVPQSRERPALTPLSVDSWVRGETEAVDDAESFEDVASQEEYALCASDRFSASDSLKRVGAPQRRLRAGPRALSCS